ncbi:MAG: hypothetical protein WCV79_03645 [Candidatus Paceibacterota bacterium]|jgi:hypothetical protein
MRNIGKYKLIGSVLLAMYLYRCIANPDFSHILDNINLIFHEAGHVIFIFFGDLLYSLGGSILQILIPLVLSAYFFLRRENYAGFFVLAWAGYSIVSVSIYMNDAIAMNLPLLGGESSTHDWNHIFSTLNIISHTHTLANATRAVGMSVLVVFILFCFRYSMKYDKLGV